MSQTSTPESPELADRRRARISVVEVLVRVFPGTFVRTATGYIWVPRATRLKS